MRSRILRLISLIQSSSFISIRESSVSSASNSLLLSNIDLYADLQGGQVCGALLVEASGDFFTVHTVYPVEMFRHGPCFVGLDRADEVPDQIQVLKLGNFLHGFLQIALPKLIEPAIMRNPDLLGGPVLADRKYKNVTIPKVAFFHTAPYSLQ